MNRLPCRELRAIIPDPFIAPVILVLAEPMANGRVSVRPFRCKIRNVPSARELGEMGEVVLSRARRGGGGAVVNFIWSQTAASLAPRGRRMATDISYACDVKSKWSTVDVTMAALDPEQVAKAVALSLCANPHVKDARGQNCRVSFANNQITYQPASAPAAGGQQPAAPAPIPIFSLQQITAFCEGPAKHAPPHLVVQYIVVIASLVCISNDIMKPGETHTAAGKCHDLGKFLQGDSLAVQIDQHIIRDNTKCIIVQMSIDTILRLTLNIAPPNPAPDDFAVDITVTFADYPAVPRLMMSMILLNFMMSAAQERLEYLAAVGGAAGAGQGQGQGQMGGAPLPFKKTEDSWLNLVEGAYRAPQANPRHAPLLPPPPPPLQAPGNQLNVSVVLPPGDETTPVYFACANEGGDTVNCSSTMSQGVQKVPLTSLNKDQRTKVSVVLARLPVFQGTKHSEIKTENGRPNNNLSKVMFVDGSGSISSTTREEKVYADQVVELQTIEASTTGEDGIAKMVFNQKYGSGNRSVEHSIDELTLAFYSTTNLTERGIESIVKKIACLICELFDVPTGPIDKNGIMPDWDMKNFMIMYHLIPRLIGTTNVDLQGPEGIHNWGDFIREQFDKWIKFDDIPINVIDYRDRTAAPGPSVSGTLS